MFNHTVQKTDLTAPSDYKLTDLEQNYKQTPPDAIRYCIIYSDSEFDITIVKMLALNAETNFIVSSVYISPLKI